MQIRFLFIALLIVNISAAQWKALDAKLTTPWTGSVTPSKVLAEYPRPQMVRNSFINLNGLWDYSILPISGTGDLPATFSGKILVPFPVESALSGVGKTVGKDSVLYYKRSFERPAGSQGKTVLLHFGAVDWESDVFINGKKVGSHKGGYDPFSFDITPFLSKSRQQEIAVRVWDPTDSGPQPRGKQVKKPEGIWYTPVTGIWQTVWLELVAPTHISSIHLTPDIDQKKLFVSIRPEGLRTGDKIRFTALDGTSKIAETEIVDTSTGLAIPSPKLWSPDQPFLYDLKIAIVRNGKSIDEVSSYFGMRKISMQKDGQGIQRMLLNDKFVFQFGPLDQGWWPDGLYTAPTDEALKFDIKKTKEMGFNMIRKHVKVEPARWYYHCDKLGMLVWQDMPSGDLGARWESRPGIEGLGREMNRTTESESIYRTEWNEIMTEFHNYPSIVVWVPFNEAWGQFKTTEITNWTMEKDKSRLVNSASGGNFVPVGHMIDLHNYPEPAMPSPSIYGRDQILVLGEYGGLGLPLENHTWQDKNNWGYQTFKNEKDLETRYAGFVDRLNLLAHQGLSAAVYTQTTDVEGEVNGLMTYDRKVFKIPLERLSLINRKAYVIP